MRALRRLLIPLFYIRNVAISATREKTERILLLSHLVRMIVLKSFGPLQILINCHSLWVMHAIGLMSRPVLLRLDTLPKAFDNTLHIVLRLWQWCRHLAEHDIVHKTTHELHFNSSRLP